MRRLTPRERRRLERLARHAYKVEPRALARDVTPFALIDLDRVSAVSVRCFPRRGEFQHDAFAALCPEI